MHPIQRIMNALGAWQPTAQADTTFHSEPLSLSKSGLLFAADVAALQHLAQLSRISRRFNLLELSASQGLTAAQQRLIIDWAVSWSVMHPSRVHRRLGHGLQIAVLSTGLLPLSPFMVSTVQELALLLPGACLTIVNRHKAIYSQG